MTDDLLGDRYVIGPLLGRGGMAEVRRAHDTRLDRDVAVKRLRIDLAGDPVFQERFRREAQSAAGLNHPNIVSVFDTGESLDEASGVMIPYIVMELVVGHTLREILHDGRKIQPVRALEITQAVLEALDYSHRHGIVHRDIKPANVMLTTAGQIKVMDFGIARAVSDTAASMTQTASVIGTPQYLSPEQIRGEQVDRRSDIYATGCLLYELLTGKPPFEGDSPVALAYQHVRSNPVPPSEIDPLVSTQMDAITLKALAKSPADRFQTAHEMAEDIGRLLSGQRVQATIPPPVVDPEDIVKTQVVAAPAVTQVMPRGTPVKPARAVAEEEEEEGHSHVGRIVGVILAGILVLSLIAVGLVAWFNREPSSPTSPAASLVSVPAVVGMKQETAVEAITARNLVAEITHVNGENNDTIGQVVLQLPDAGTMVAPQTKVTITVNDGPAQFSMPSVTGLDKDVAKAQLNAAGFTNVTLVAAAAWNCANGGANPNSLINGVSRSDPTAGATITHDQSITLYYETGQIVVPNVMGWDRDRAVSYLSGCGFPTPKVTEQPDAATAGSVIAQTPPDAQTVANTTVIDLTVAVALPPTVAPTTPEPTDSTTPPTPTESPT